jgi:hypothetical protein
MEHNEYCKFWMKGELVDGVFLTPPSAGFRWGLVSQEWGGTCTKISLEIPK